MGSYDILNPDESVFFSASYPIDPETGEEIRIYDPNYIPVGSAHSKFDLYSWLTGYFLSIYGGFKK